MCVPSLHQVSRQHHSTCTATHLDAVWGKAPDRWRHHPRRMHSKPSVYMRRRVASIHLLRRWGVPRMRRRVPALTAVAAGAVHGPLGAGDARDELRQARPAVIRRNGAGRLGVGECLLDLQALHRKQLRVLPAGGCLESGRWPWKFSAAGAEASAGCHGGDTRA